MPKQQKMTEAAAAILHFLPVENWIHVDDIAETTGISPARCQLILTQLELAKLADGKGEDSLEFRRCS